MQIRSHQMASSAFNAVEARSASTSKARKEYGALAHKLPGMILQNGMAQATGFFLAKGTAQHIAVLADLLTVLRAAGVTQVNSPGDLHQQIINADLATTMRLTRYALDASAWIKRYVQGVLGLTPTGDSVAEADAEALGHDAAVETGATP